MQMRPMTDELMLNCSEQKYCTKCKFRMGCPIRYDFYSDEQVFEIKLQMAELKARKVFPTYDKEELFKITEDIRKKRTREIKEVGPYFSYT